MSKTLTAYPIFILALIAMVAAFVTTTTYTQLGVAILLYPALVFFAYKLMPRKWLYLSKKPLRTQVDSFQAVTAEALETGKKKSLGISDIDKRMFLKMIGGTGLFFFIVSIFNKNYAGLFSKSLPAAGSGRISLEDTTGNQVNPAQDHPTDGYTISEIDENVISYYGFTKAGDGWYIMRLNTDTGSFRYSSGKSNFSNNWTNREKLKYDYFSNVF